MKLQLKRREMSYEARLGNSSHWSGLEILGDSRLMSTLVLGGSALEDRFGAIAMRYVRS